VAKRVASVIFFFVIVIILGCSDDSREMTSETLLEAVTYCTDNPAPKCTIAIPVRNTLADDEIRTMAQTELFRPPLVDNEDSDGAASMTYSVTLGFGESYVNDAICGGAKNRHLGCDYDVNGADRRYPVRAIGDGIVVYAGYVCKLGEQSGDCRAAIRQEQWGWMVRILHRLKNPAISGGSEYVLSNYAHLEGPPDGSDKSILPVTVGQRVASGQIIGAIGSTRKDNGNVSWAPHLHFAIVKVNPWDVSDAANAGLLDGAGWGYSCDANDGRLEHYVNPSEMFAGFGWSGTNIVTVGQHPPGTIVAVADWDGAAFAQRMYLVSGPGVVRHVEDEAAYYANRLYHDSSDRWGLAVPVSGHEFGCYEEGEPIRAGSSSITAAKCGKGTYVGFYGFGPPYRRRVAPDESLAAHRVILKSWGLKPGEVKASGAECGWPEAEQLWLRDGTVVEQASDDDFYVVSEGGYAFRLKRETFAVMGYPFSAVIQVPGGSVPSMVRGMRHGRDEFTVDDAMSCPNGAKGGSVEQESAPPDVQPDPPQDPPPGPCAHHAHRCGADPRSYEVCLMNYEGPENRELGTEWGAFPCPEGQECVGGGDCATPTPSAEPDVPDGGGAGGAPGDADGPAPDPQSQDGGGAGDGGRDVDAGSRPGMTEGGGVTGGAGGAPEGDAPEPTAPADPPHTIRCARRDDGTTLVTVTGPLLDGLSLMEGPSGEPSALMLGADGVGWPGPVSVPWLGDGAVHSVALPAGVESFNLYLAGADGPDWDPAAGTGTNSWLRLYEADGSPWATAGDCVMGAGLVLVLPREDAP
jgi:murein DD-endopeptidase MepM/ murein hydrolase activator NlpD